MPVMEYTWVVALRADDELAGRESLTFADLVEREYIMSSSKVHPVAMNQLRDFVLRAGVTRIKELDGSDSVSVAAHVARSQAFALTVENGEMPGRRIFEDPRYSLIPLHEPDLHFRVGIAWRDERYKSDPSLREVIKAIRSRVPAPVLAGANA